MSWRQTKLDDLFEIGSAKRVLKAQWQSEGVPFYRGREITKLSSQGYVDNELFISEELYSEYKNKYGVPSSGDIVITAIGTIGNSYIVQDSDKFYYKDASVLCLKKVSDVDSQFINYWLKSSNMRSQLDEGNGATVDTLTISKMKSLTIDLPTLPEQKRIVAILDEAFAGIDQAIANTEKNLASARELFESHINTIFIEKGEAWETTTLGEVADVEYGFTDKSGSDGDFRYVRITDIDNNGELTKSNKKYISPPVEAEKFVLNDNDLLMARTGATFAKVLLYKDIEPSIFASYLIRISFKVPIKNELYWFFSKSVNYWEQANSLSSGAAQPHFNGAALKRVIFSYPTSIREQEKIIKLFHSMFLKTQNLEDAYKHKLASLNELKQSLLQKAFSGELTADAKVQAEAAE